MELFRQAVTVMALGMGLVFIFLAAVISCVKGVSSLVRRWEMPDANAANTGDERALAAAIAVALHEKQAAGRRTE